MTVLEDVRRVPYDRSGLLWRQRSEAQSAARLTPPSYKSDPSKGSTTSIREMLRYGTA